MPAVLREWTPRRARAAATGGDAGGKASGGTPAAVLESGAVSGGSDRVVAEAPPAKKARQTQP